MSNHLGDTNKMVSGNPRMDASAHDDGAIWQTGCELELELNAANEMLRKLNIHALNLTDRIRRLEEAGDALEYASVILEAGEDPNGFEKLLIAQREWRKAKEAKL
jgi:hypothetical protein